MKKLDTYEERSGTLIRKRRTVFGRYVFIVRCDAESNSVTSPETVSVQVGKGLYELLSSGEKLTIGYCGKQLVNITPALSELREYLNKAEAEKAELDL